MSNSALEVNARLVKHPPIIKPDLDTKTSQSKSKYTERNTSPGMLDIYI